MIVRIRVVFLAAALAAAPANRVAERIEALAADPKPPARRDRGDPE
jgi:hypothetical protein